MLKNRQYIFSRMCTVLKNSYSTFQKLEVVAHKSLQNNQNYK